MKTGYAHVFDGPGFVELGQDGAHLVVQVWTNPARIILLKEPLQAFVSKPGYRVAL